MAAKRQKLINPNRWDAGDGEPNKNFYRGENFSLLLKRHRERLKRASELIRNMTFYEEIMKINFMLSARRGQWDEGEKPRACVHYARSQSQQI
jgi:hypothetical protein